MKKLSIVHASGFSNLKAETSVGGIGVGAGAVGIGVGSAHTSGTQQTALSQKVAPPSPRKPDSDKAMVGCLMMFLALGVALASKSAAAFVVTLIAAVIIAVVLDNKEREAVKTWNQIHWLPRKAAWDRSVMCMRCGHIWELAGAT